ncbi:MAG TPA: Smr/MutS family protein [Casimicrobiaceae bacterium]|nr:Smr/MutS family protein [Casimicrobiaceae bacterium]
MAKLGELKKLLDAKRVATGKRATPPRSATSPCSIKRSLGATKHGDADIDVAQVFRDVRRLPPRNRAHVARPAPSPIPKQRLADEQDALLASKYGAETIEHSWEVGQEHEGEQTFLRRGLGTDILTKLRRGHWSLQGEIDLHGATSDEARDQLADFLLDARNRGARCVRIIHGKGLTSPGREPVLKGKVRRWLAHWDDVLAFCEAPRHAGGGGAVLVLLRGR